MEWAGNWKAIELPFEELNVVEKLTKSTIASLWLQPYEMSDLV